ncbi:MAG: hypothetical protein IJF55_01210 [Clostridia bacterium]|nr:hypothetical protein [Clostridia bacterium]
MKIFGREIRIQDKKKLASIIAVSLAVVILVIDIGYHTSKSLADGVNTLPVKENKYDAAINTSAYLVKDEQYVYSSMTGNVEYYIKSGSKVSKNEPLAGVYYKSGGSYSLIETLTRLNLMREAIVLASRQWDEATETSLDARINAVYDSIYNCLADKRIGDADLYRESLRALLLAKEVMNNNLSISSALKACDDAISAVREKVGYPVETVKLQSAGWFFSEIDGYEERIDLDGALSLSVKEAEKLFDPLYADEKEENPVVTTSAPEEAETPEEGEDSEEDSDDPGLDIYKEKSCIGKIVESETFRAVCIVSSAETSKLSIGKRYQCRVGDFEVEMTLEKIIFEKGSDKRVLILSCNTQDPSHPFERITDISIIYASYKGFKIPTSAIREIDGVYGVYIKRGFIVQFREVVPLFAENGMMIVTNDKERSSGSYKLIAQNDNVILKGTDLYDGKILK